MDCERDARRCSDITHALVRRQGVVAERRDGVSLRVALSLVRQQKPAPYSHQRLIRKQVATKYFEALEINLPV